MGITVDVTPTIAAPFVRAGHYFYFGSRDQVLVSVFPWAGVEYDITRGEVVWTRKYRRSS